MALPVAVSTDEAWDRIKTSMRAIRTRAVAAKAAMAAGAIGTEYVLNLHTDLHNAWSSNENLKTTPGLEAYVQSVVNDPEVDLAAEFVAVQAKLVACRDWIETNWPKSNNAAPNDVWLLRTKFVNHVATENTFSSAATAGLQTELQNLVDLISIV